MQMAQDYGFDIMDCSGSGSLDRFRERMLLFVPYPRGTLESLPIPGLDDVLTRPSIVENESNLRMQDEYCNHHKVPSFTGSDDASREGVCPGEHISGIRIEGSKIEKL